MYSGRLGDDQGRSKTGAYSGPQWSGRAQHADGWTSSLVPTNERHHTSFFAHYSPSISFALTWQFASQQASFPRESSTPTTKEENWRGLFHLEADASACQRENNWKEDRYGQLWYVLPSVFAGMVGTSSSSSGSGYKNSTRSSQCSFTRVLSLFWI